MKPSSGRDNWRKGTSQMTFDSCGNQRSFKKKVRVANMEKINLDQVQGHKNPQMLSTEQCLCRDASSNFTGLLSLKAY